MIKEISGRLNRSINKHDKLSNMAMPFSLSSQNDLVTYNLIHIFLCSLKLSLKVEQLKKNPIYKGVVN